MKHISSCIILVFLIYAAVSCSGQAEKFVIKGSLENLPDGKMVLFTRSRQTGKIILIDSVKTRKGAFAFSIDPVVYPEAIHIYMNHYTNETNTKRIFQYKTNQKPNGRKISTDGFMLEDGIEINGVLEEYTSSVFKPGKNVVPTAVDRPIIVGRQTRLFYDDTLGFNPLVGNPRLTNVAQIKTIIKQHSYSYYYLYAMERRVSEFSNEAFLSIFQVFDKDVQESQTGRNLLAYVKNRVTKRLSYSTTLIDRNGQSQPILDKEARYNLVVLWASWCGPCRREIPNLKQLYGRLGHDQQFHLISVSLDEDKDAWEKAIQKEQMPWRQLLITTSVQPYAKEIFQFDGSIPTMLLINQQGKVIKKVVGYDEDNLADIEELITRQ